MLRHLQTLARLIVNAAAAALMVPLLLLALILILNPDASPGLGGIAGAWLTLTLAYGVPIGIGFPLAFSIVRFFAAHPLRIGWLHLKSAVWFLLVGIGGTVGLYAFNLHLSGDMLGSRGKSRLMGVLVVLTFSWLAAALLTATAEWRSEDERSRKRMIAFLLLVATGPEAILVASIAGGRISTAPYATPEAGTRGGTVVLLGIEGATFSEILPLVSEGKLANFSRLVKEGSYGPLRTVEPCRSEAAWGSVGTGKMPHRHGIKNGALYALAGMPGTLRSVPSGVLFRHWLSPRWLGARRVTGEDLRARPLWGILDKLGLEAAFVSWPLTATPRPAGRGAEALEREERAREWLRRILAGTGGSASRDDETDLLLAITADLESLDALKRIIIAGRPRVLAAHFPGLGRTSARFMRYRRSEGVTEPPDEEMVRSARVLERYYDMLDQMVGEVRGLVPPDAYLFVLSAYGAEPFDFLHRFARKVAGLPEVAAGHGTGPAGVLLVAGPGAAVGRQVDDLRVTDVVPLTLYVLGAPVGRDMEGRLASRVFDRAFLEANPITFIPTYD